MQDYEYLKEVNKEELLKNRWLDPETSPTLSVASTWGNRLAHWFAYELIKTKDRHKAKYLSQFLKICEVCWLHTGANLFST